MSWKALFIALITTASLLCAQTSPPNPTSAPSTAPAAPKFTRVELFRRSDAAIRRGAKFLLSRQNSDGSWSGEKALDDHVGNTALVTLALLYAGESHQSPAIERAIKFLKSSHPERIVDATYSIGLRAAVYASLPEPARKQELQADLRWLQNTVIRQGGDRGMYGYGSTIVSRGDYSNSQYGVLGVWYAAQAGIEVPRSYWKLVEDGWLDGQNGDGGWPYRKTGPSYASMTAAGAATLFITNDYLRADAAHDLDQPLAQNKALEEGMKWIAQNFDPDENIGREDRPGRGRGRGDREVIDLMGNLGHEPGFVINYMLFGYERVGEASGLTRFGDRKWFDEGAQHLIEMQGYDGGWLTDGIVGTEGNTAYALLFLSRGRAPVVIEKLQFDGRWNNRPRDASAFTQFMRRATERHVNWQIAALDAPAEELRESPMLYVASDQALNLNASQRDKIKNYIDQGGMLVCVNEGKRDDFAKSVIALAGEMYPAYKFRELPKDHLAYTANFPVPSDQLFRSLGNGVRELIVLYPTGDISWRWQSTAGAFITRSSPYASLANLWLYATDRSNPKYKGEDSWVDYNPGVIAEKTVKIARLRHSGNWNPEPAGWQRLTNTLHNFDQVDLKVEATTDPKGAALAHLTSTDSVQLLPTTKFALKQYLDSGGLLLLDAAGGSAEAAGSFEPLLRELYPTVVIAPLPLDHRIYRAATMGGTDIESVNYRRSRDLTPVHIARLRGASVNGKLIAIVSNEDLSGALVGYSTAGLVGYMPASAVDLVRNIILWRTSALR